MSRIGKLPITIPENVDVNYKDSEITVKGKFGTLQTKIPSVINITQDDGQLKVGLKEEFLSRYLNEGFSGGEKKRAEVLQMAVLKPKISILDEPDSGLDIDAVQAVAQAISKVADKDATIIIITHYARILNFLDKLDFVHVFARGQVLKTGDASLAAKLEAEGYEWALEQSA